MLSKVIYNLGVKFRNPHLNKFYIELKRTEKISLKELQELQLIKCKSFLIFAFEYSPFWNEYFKKYSFNPYKFSTLNDLKKIPTISKKELLLYNNTIHTKYNFKKKFFSETSGSTGEPLKFWKNEEWDSFNRASIMRGYSWYSILPWERNGYLWGYNFKLTDIIKIKVLDLLQNRFRLFKYDEKDVQKFLKKLRKASYLHGYSSMIYELSKKVIQYNMSPQYFKNLKFIKGTSEKIFKNYQSEVKKAFGLQIISEYGAAESGIIAFECPFGNMHINMEGVIVESENNEIIITNLYSKSFPIIRYKLGDYIKIAQDDFFCPCGMKHPIIKNVMGRVGKTIYGINNIYPSLTLYYIFKNIALEYNVNINYLVVQEEKGHLIFKIEQNLDNYSKTVLRNEIIKYFKEDIYFTILTGQNLISKNSKKRDFISYIK